MAQSGSSAAWWIVACLAIAACGKTHTSHPPSGADGGSAGKTADGGKPVSSFDAKLIGDEIVVQDLSKAPHYYVTCSGYAALQKREGSDWMDIQDDRQHVVDFGYYEDDAYVQIGLGCDTVSCLAGYQPFAELPAYEYVANGTREAPPSSSFEPGAVLEVIERHPLSGKVRVNLVYYTDAGCKHEQKTSLELTIPEDGVCCPIGSTGCSSSGPGGGWAASLDACAPWDMAYDVGYLVHDDPRGCPRLEENEDACCGCPKMSDPR